MTRTIVRILSYLAGAGLMVTLALGAAFSAAPKPGEPVVAADASQLFPDAPDGVDPMVTGPVSASFKQKQADLGCVEAAWPKIPAGCYPK